MHRTLCVLLLMVALVSVGAAAADDGAKNTIQLISPVAGASWEEGSSQIVRWVLDLKVAPDSIQIVLAGNGLKPMLLTTFIKADPGLWKWDYVKPAGDKMTLQVIAYLSKNVTLQGSQVISITPALSIGNDNPNTKLRTGETGPASSLVIAAPNGGERWKVGAVKAIKWTTKLLMKQSDKDARFTIMLSRDGGKSYDEKIASDLSTDMKQFKWIVTEPASPTCRVKVMLTGMAIDVVIEDTSDKDFQVVSGVAKPIHDPVEH